MEAANRQIACDLGATGRLVRSAFAPLSAPRSFRERLWQRLVAEAAPDHAAVRAAGAASTERRRTARS
jgi:hypothetical protein